MTNSILAKPTQGPIRRDSVGAAGMRAAYLLARPGDYRDRASGYDGSAVGSPTWGNGLYGAQLGNFSTSNYVAADAVAAAGFGQSWPFWFAALAVNSNSGAMGYVASGGLAAGGNNLIGLAYNAGTVSWYMRDAAGHSLNPTYATAASYDGQPHVVMGVMAATASASLYWDGAAVGSDASTTVSAVPCDQFTWGALRRSSVAAPFPGSLIAAAVGWGSVPDPARLAADWLSGRFSAFRARPPEGLLAAAVAAGGTAYAATGAGVLIPAGSGAGLAGYPASGAAVLGPAGSGNASNPAFVSAARHAPKWFPSLDRRWRARHRPRTR